MPLTAKGSEIEANMKKEYGSKKGESVFYASKNKGTISGVDSAGDKAMSNQTPGLAKAFDAMNALMDGCTRLAGRVDSFVSRRADGAMDHESAAAWHTNQSKLPENKFFAAQHNRAAELHMAAVEAHTARDPAAKDKSEYAMKFSKVNKLDRK